VTFSLVARCADTGMFGVAISSSSPAVAARCSYARAGVGAVASQNITDPTLGSKGLNLLENGASAQEAIADIRKTGRHIDYRQVLLVDASGETAIHSGRQTLGIWSEAKAGNVASGGNLLAAANVPRAIVDGFIESNGHLGDRLIAAMRVGLEAGGEAGPVHSAGMMLVDKVPWPIVDLRCDWTEECPIENIATAWEVYKPQIAAYIQRAVDPSAAPGFDVAGEDDNHR